MWASHTASQAACGRMAEDRKVDEVPMEVPVLTLPWDSLVSSTKACQRASRHGASMVSMECT